MAEQYFDSPRRFYGYMESAVDDKGRILIDKKNRDRLGPNFVAAMLPIGCLALYPRESWRARESQAVSYTHLTLPTILLV